MVQFISRYIITTLVMLTLLTACDDDPEFRIEGTVEGLGTRNIVMTYVADRSVHTDGIVAIDGKFILVGASKTYTIVELSTAQHQLVGRVLIKNGQTLKCDFNLEDFFDQKVSGNKPSEQWSKFLRDNSDALRSGDHILNNRLVAEYVESHKDNILSSALMLTQFYAPDHESQADSIFATIAPEARPESLVDNYRLILSRINSAAFHGRIRTFTLTNLRDTTERYYAGRSSYTLFYFSGQGNEHRDTIYPTLRELHDSINHRWIRVYEVSMAQDTSMWKRIARQDSVGWPRVWVPGGSANTTFDDLDIPRLPYYILSDSVGDTAYRGSSVKTATDTLFRRLRHNKVM
ncbi:MAG: hypothetical protein NC127_05590 [Muribaculum sp.]|nr:hypothetical protein [Muribaculum sp.]